MITCWWRSWFHYRLVLRWGCGGLYYSWPCGFRPLLTWGSFGLLSWGGFRRWGWFRLLLRCARFRLLLLNWWHVCLTFPNVILSSVMKAPVALFTSFGLQNLFIHGILCTNKVDYLILWLITSIIAMSRSHLWRLPRTSLDGQWLPATTWTHVLSSLRYKLLSSGGPSGHTNGDCKPSSHLALYPTPLEITQHKNYTKTVGYTVPFLYVHVRKLHGRYHLPDVGPPTEDQWNQ